MKNGRYEDAGGFSCYKNDQLHCETGPAREWTNCVQDWSKNKVREWWIEGKLHRLDGPAIMSETGRQEWYLNGVKYTEEQFNEKVKEFKTLQ